MRSRRSTPRPAAAAGAALAGFLLAIAAATGAAAAGPPFPDPEVDRAVYDTAEVLDRATVDRVEGMIDAIEQRTGAEIVVYTQEVPCCESEEGAEVRARALMDQWGVGRRGFDDGLVILFDLHEFDTCHGQVQLYAGPGYRAKFLSNEERQKVFDEDMLPLLRGCDLDGALLAGMARVDAAATPEHASELNFFRQLNAVLGLLVAPLLAVFVVGWGLTSWLRHGRDPVYLDDPSIHIPAPPRGLTPAAGVVIREGRSTRRALTAASLDLAARGLIAFRAEKAGLLGTSTKLGILTTPEFAEQDAYDETGAPLPPGPPGSPPQIEPEAQFRRDRARARPMDEATGYPTGTSPPSPATTATSSPTTSSSSGRRSRGSTRRSSSMSSSRAGSRRRRQRRPSGGWAAACSSRSPAPSACSSASSCRPTGSSSWAARCSSPGSCSRFSPGPCPR